MDKSIFENVTQNTDSFIPGVSIDCVIFGFDSGCIKVLLCKFNKVGKWMLPSGFIRKEEDADAAASRVLEVRTGLKDVYLKQFHFFGKKDRVDGVELKDYMHFDVNEEKANWYLTRFITLGYYALVKFEEARIMTNEFDEAKWFDINDIPDLYGDHKEIADTAINTIRKQIGYIPMGYELLPEKFTMPELRAIYEAILGREIDRRNFQRKILSIGYIKPLNETRKSGAHKAPNLYAFIKDKYKEAEEYGVQIMTSAL